jgi:hypothetical protein
MRSRKNRFFCAHQLQKVMNGERVNDNVLTYHELNLYSFFIFNYFFLV